MFVDLPTTNMGRAGVHLLDGYRFLALLGFGHSIAPDLASLFATTKAACKPLKVKPSLGHILRISLLIGKCGHSHRAQRRHRLTSSAK